MYDRIFKLHADAFKALSHPSRLEIVQLLRDQELAVTDIHTMLDLPQANISQHLRILKSAGILTTRRDGKQMYYKIANPKILTACDLFREHLIDLHLDSELAPRLALPLKELLPVVHDSVCQMRLSPKTASFHHHHNHVDYYFCASGCLATFIKKPEAYVQS